MRKIFQAVVATAALVAVTAPAQAQTVTSSTGTTSSTSAIQSTVSAAEMKGMKISGMLEDGSISGFDMWRDLGSDTWGADLWSGAEGTGTHIATVSMTPGSADTYHTNWSITLYQTNNLKSLSFEGGASYGGVLFDRTRWSFDSCGLFVGTCGSDIGRDFNTIDSKWTGITANYTNAVGLGSDPIVGDIFSRVDVDFTQAQWCRINFIICYRPNADVPDVDGPNPNPFGFMMDTDLGTFSTVPEPSTYALMGFGLAALGFVSRRRRNVRRS